jgi:hypothetical protein
LPVFSASISTSRSAFSSIASAIRSRHVMRSLGVVWRQSSSNAARAAFIASSTSAGPDSGALANGSPVDGLTISSEDPSRVPLNSPPT